jgi:hypothetical protein
MLVKRWDSKSTGHSYEIDSNLRQFVSRFQFSVQYEFAGFALGE